MMGGDVNSFFEDSHGSYLQAMERLLCSVILFLAYRCMFLLSIVKV